MHTTKPARADANSCCLSESYSCIPSGQHAAALSVLHTRPVSNHRPPTVFSRRRLPPRTDSQSGHHFSPAVHGSLRASAGLAPPFSAPWDSATPHQSHPAAAACWPWLATVAPPAPPLPAASSHWPARGAHVVLQQNNACTSALAAAKKASCLLAMPCPSLMCGIQEVLGVGQAALSRPRRIDEFTSADAHFASMQ